MKYKVLNKEHMNFYFYDIPYELGKKISKYYEMHLFLQIPNLKKTDILELFEMTILTSFDNEAEMDEAIFADYLFDFSNLYKLANHYADDYVAIVGQLFLDDCIDFWRCVYHKMDNANTKTPNLSQYKKENKYETWKYFRDNYIYSYNDNLVNHATKGDFWGNLDNWDMYNINCFHTQKGTKYFNEILAPKFYNKYKDLEVEIDDKGNIIRWIGKINR
ncbi:hypothetical protein NLM63_000554 [Campylobacter coli]|nr:hypothetical protein [Campylobacter coli]